MGGIVCDPAETSKLFWKCKDDKKRRLQQKLGRFLGNMTTNIALTLTRPFSMPFSRVLFDRQISKVIKGNWKKKTKICLKPFWRALLVLIDYLNHFTTIFFRLHKKRLYRCISCNNQRHLTFRQHIKNHIKYHRFRSGNTSKLAQITRTWVCNEILKQDESYTSVLIRLQCLVCCSTRLI